MRTCVCHHCPLWSQWWISFIFVQSILLPVQKNDWRTCWDWENSALKFCSRTKNITLRSGWSGYSGGTHTQMHSHKLSESHTQPCLCEDLQRHITFQSPDPDHTNPLTYCRPRPGLNWKPGVGSCEDEMSQKCRHVTQVTLSSDWTASHWRVGYVFFHSWSFEISQLCPCSSSAIGSVCVKVADDTASGVSAISIGDGGARKTTPTAHMCTTFIRHSVKLINHRCWDVTVVIGPQWRCAALASVSALFLVASLCCCHGNERTSILWRWLQIKGCFAVAVTV